MSFCASAVAHRWLKVHKKLICPEHCVEAMAPLQHFRSVLSTCFGILVNNIGFMDNMFVSIPTVSKNGRSHLDAECSRTCQHLATQLLKPPVNKALVRHSPKVSRTSRRREVALYWQVVMEATAQIFWTCYRRYLGSSGPELQQDIPTRVPQGPKKSKTESIMIRNRPFFSHFDSFPTPVGLLGTSCFQFFFFWGGGGRRAQMTSAADKSFRKETSQI